MGFQNTGATVLGMRERNQIVQHEYSTNIPPLHRFEIPIEFKPGMTGMQENARPNTLFFDGAEDSTHHQSSHIPRTGEVLIQQKFKRPLRVTHRQNDLETALAHDSTRAAPAAVVANIFQPDAIDASGQLPAHQPA